AWVSCSRNLRLRVRGIGAELPILRVLNEATEIAKHDFDRILFGRLMLMKAFRFKTSSLAYATIH
ncbi:MAG TPA: hypothetical protein VN956_25165, partial [Pyrinomonadaceae bacterium]|nr:hypothetical protein [Pyrinomonadaceae bacterium]